jgi:Nucleotidyl transferase of unknown function (DUF2204)
MFAKDFKELIRIFNKNGVEYLLIGGYAFGVHAQPRATKDLDLFIRSNVPNSEAVFRALCEFGAPLDGMTTQDFRDGESGLEFGKEPQRVDILQKISGVTFEEAWEKRVSATIEGDTPISVISREHLVQNKRAAGRPRDLLDVKEIEKAGQDQNKVKPVPKKQSSKDRGR